MKKIRLGDVCLKIGSGATPRGGSEVYLDSGVSLIRSQNIYNEGFKRDGLVFINSRHAEELGNVVVQEGDVLLNITGDSVARSCQVPDQVLPARVNQHVAIIRPDAKLLDPAFLRYCLIDLQCSSVCSR
jgi:type I restriction enzyme, S subunit